MRGGRREDPKDPERPRSACVCAFVRPRYTFYLAIANHFPFFFSSFFFHSSSRLFFRSLLQVATRPRVPQPGTLNAPTCCSGINSFISFCLNLFSPFFII